MIVPSPDLDGAPTGRKWASGWCQPDRPTVRRRQRLRRFFAKLTTWRILHGLIAVLTVRLGGALALN